MADPVRVAVLIDCENISHKLAEAILAETTKHGTVTVKRGYGDWSSPHLVGWRTALPAFAIQPFQQFSYVAGKNSSDAALIVDAMDLLYADNVDVFCIVSGDSDFTRLVTRLRESGRKVYGMGARNTHESFVNAFDRFTFTEVLDGSTVQVAEEEPVGQVAGLPQLKSVISSAIAASSKDDGWAALSTAGHYIVNNHPSFDSRNYGFPKLSALVRSLSYVEVSEMSDTSATKQVKVRLR